MWVRSLLDTLFEKFGGNYCTLLLLEEEKIVASVVHGVFVYWNEIDVKTDDQICYCCVRNYYFYSFWNHLLPNFNFNNDWTEKWIK